MTRHSYLDDHRNVSAVSGFFLVLVWYILLSMSIFISVKIWTILETAKFNYCSYAHSPKGVSRNDGCLSMFKGRCYNAFMENRDTASVLYASAV